MGKKRSSLSDNKRIKDLKINKLTIYNEINIKKNYEY